MGKQAWSKLFVLLLVLSSVQSTTSPTPLLGSLRLFPWWSVFVFLCLVGWVFFARTRHHFLCNIPHFGNEKATVGEIRPAIVSRILETWYWGQAGQVLAIFCPVQVILLFTSSLLSRKGQFAVLYFLHLTVQRVCESWLGPVSFSAFLKRRILVLHLSFLQEFITFYLS